MNGDGDAALVYYWCRKGRDSLPAFLTHLCFSCKSMCSALSA
jgi:hypothetical protein